MARWSPGQVVEGLVKRGVPLHVAQGVTMNFMDESGLESGIQEANPKSGRGGFGFAQWTGPRRLSMEEYAFSQNKPINDPDMQLDFFMLENGGAEAGAWKQVLAAPTAQEAAATFVNKWERPDSRYAAQRTAKYMGSDIAKATSPYGLQARHPGQTTVGTGGYVAPGADKTQVPLKDAVRAAKADDKNKMDKYQEAASGAMDVFANMKAPTMSSLPQMPTQAPLPMDSMPIVAQGGAAGGGRDQFAMLMQALNSGKLWG